MFFFLPSRMGWEAKGAGWVGLGCTHARAHSIARIHGGGHDDDGAMSRHTYLQGKDKNGRDWEMQVAGWPTRADKKMQRKPS